MDRAHYQLQDHTAPPPTGTCTRYALTGWFDNPVSNSIYQRIGYRPVEDRVVLSFSER